LPDLTQGITMHYKLHIPNSKPSGKALKVYSPYDGSLVASCDVLDATGAEKALQNAES